MRITLEDHTVDEQFAVSLDPLKGGQPVILGDTFFAAAPFRARIAHGETFLADARRQPSTINTE